MCVFTIFVLRLFPACFNPALTLTRLKFNSPAQMFSHSDVSVSARHWLWIDSFLYEVPAGTRSSSAVSCRKAAAAAAGEKSKVTSQSQVSLLTFRAMMTSGAASSSSVFSDQSSMFVSAARRSSRNFFSVKFRPTQTYPTSCAGFHSKIASVNSKLFLNVLFQNPKHFEHFYFLSQCQLQQYVPQRTTQDKYQ